MGGVVQGFCFSDFCLKCQKVTEHQIEVDGRKYSGVCSSCGRSRPMVNPTQVHYPKTDLWVTRFKIGNLPSVVAGKLLDASKSSNS